MLPDHFHELRSLQEEVLNRRQVLEPGYRPHDLERWTRHRDLNRVLPGVYLTRTGPPSWIQRAWAAVLWAEPAALAWGSAVRAAGGRPTTLPGEERDEPIHLLVERSRQLRPPPWVIVHAQGRLESSVIWATSPPRQREEHAALEVAVAHLQRGSRRSHLHAVAAIAEPIQARRTTAARVRRTLDDRARIPHRAWLTGVITDVAAGTTSVLEHGYVSQVGRPHALPPALLQARLAFAPATTVRDALLPTHQIVELDGRAFHQGSGRRHDDLERDLDAAAAGFGTLRLGWGQVFDRPCSTARKVAAVLATRGWAGEPTDCSPGCSARREFLTRT